jgi:hypothetical protein
MLHELRNSMHYELTHPSSALSCSFAASLTSIAYTVLLRGGIIKNSAGVCHLILQVIA